MARPRTPVGTFGDITFAKAGGKVRARTRYRDDDGKLRRVQATGASEAEALRHLKTALTKRQSRRTYGELSPDSSFPSLVKIWLEDLDLDGTLAPSTRELYERDMRTIVMPAFENLILREITVSRVDRFLRHLAANRSYATAKHARTVLSLALNLYVSMTRGRESNIAYVALDQPDDSHSTPEPDEVNARTVLFGVLQHTGASLSAHQTIEVEYEIHGGIDRLAAELETIAAEAQHERFVGLLNRSGLTTDQHTAVVESSAFGPLTAALRRAEAYHHDLERLVPRVVGQHDLGDADDIAAVLRYRVDKVASASPRGCRLRPRLIAGLVPEPLGAMSAEDRRAVDERKALIEARARELVDRGIERREPWLRRLGEQPADPVDRGRWILAASTVATYRDRYKITGDLPLGGGATSDAQRADRQRAQSALREALRLSQTPEPPRGRPAPALHAVSGP